METKKAATPKTPSVPVRSLPEDLGAEAAVLGSMIIDPRCIGRVVEKLDRTAFYHAEHQVLWDVIVALYDRNGGSGVDGLLVRNELERIKKLDEIGGSAYLQRVIETVPSSASVEYYADIVRSKHQCREIIALGTEAMNMAFDGSQDPAEIMSQLEGQLYRLCSSGKSRDAVATQDLVTSAYDALSSRKPGSLSGLSTGFLQLDDMLCGLQKGEMIIIGARPSIGKTAFAMNIAENVALLGGHPTLVFSMEMPALQLSIRSLCGLAGVDQQRARKALLSPMEFQMILEACGRLGQAPLYVDDTSSLTPILLRSKARQYVAKYGIELIVLDYAQLMHIEGKVESQTAEMTQISKAVKGLARELNIPIILISQLNRANESRADKRPQMSDLRQSGQFEADADVIILLHREDYYHKTDQQYNPNNLAEVIITKQRNGPTGVVNLTFRDKLTRFENRAAEQQEPF